MTVPAGDVDLRADRAVQAAIGILLLAAFVFRLPWLPPLLAVALALGAILGPIGNPFHVAFARWIEPRLKPRTATVDARAVRAQDTLGAVILFAAGLAYVSGLGIVAWLLSVVEAVVAIVAATTHIHLGEQIRHAISHRR